ncbi:MAG: 16S rRNA (cytosine(1402)-N(4))-methyltransferase RsmH [Saccharofermentans sp.]|nr:16S rRNA (cytosine(1402)-N(4))-methyltransferase RsmH [Saccharofermentans sp.]
MDTNNEFVHIPVLFEECMDALDINPDGIYVDCTAGGGGHSSGIVSRLSSKGRLISLDKDDEALAACRRRSEQYPDKNWELVKTDFGRIAEVLSEMNIDKVDGILADLGVSSHQIDTPERGFSYAVDGPLDMRMDETSPLSAQVVVNTYSEAELTRIFRLYGEERFSGRIATGIVRDRKDEPFTNTLQLANKIASYMPAKARNEDQHPARRCFQAIRIEVNHELDAVERLLHDGPRLLNESGRMAVISFHSLEDRIVKDGFKILESPCTCPRDLPRCVCGKKPLGKAITRKPILASKDEIKNNTRAHCCKLRVFERNDENDIWN